MSRQSELNIIADQYDLAETHIGYAFLYRGYAYSHWQSGQVLDAIYDLTIAVMQNNFAIDRIVYNMAPYDGGGMIYHFLKDYTWPEVESTPLTWQSICQAWTLNNFEGKEWTISIIDHMRRLMWDEPYFIQWAANPESAR